MTRESILVKSRVSGYNKDDITYINGHLVYRIIEILLDFSLKMAQNIGVTLIIDMAPASIVVKSTFNLRKAGLNPD